MKRAGVLSLLLVLGLIATSLPLSEPLSYWTNHVEAGRNDKKGVRRRRSRAWWRRYRVRLRRQRALREARRRQRQELEQSLRRSHGDSLLPKPIAPAHSAAIVAPPRLPVPNSWSMVGVGAQGEMKFNVMANNRIAGTTAWGRVGGVQPSALSVSGPRAKMLGGVPTSSLRRTVIDRMIAEGGWVINDVERRIGERRVFVVLAQNNDAQGARLTRAFYFTEIEGQLYSLATTAPIEFADQLAAQSEQVVAALDERRSAQAAQSK